MPARNQLRIAIALGGLVATYAAAGLAPAASARPAEAVSLDTSPNGAQENPLEVRFMDSAPAADGLLLPHEAELPAFAFPVELRFDNPSVEVPQIRYRTGYTATHLYIAISTTADQITYRNRGWLWGDGWRIILSDTSLGPRSSRFVELVISPRRDAEREVSLAARDGVQFYRPLSSASSVNEAQTADGTLFEARIAWSDVAPFNPLFANHIGLNLYFAKALESEETGPFAYGYALVEDEAIFDEEILSRRTVTTNFASPPSAEKEHDVWRVRSRTVARGQPLILDSPRLSPSRPPYENVEIDDRQLGLASGQGTVAWSIDTTTLEAGKHRIRLPSADDAATEIFILPPLDTQMLVELAQDKAKQLRRGTVESIQFLGQDYDEKLARLEPYADASDLVDDGLRLERIETRLRAGDDPFPATENPMRRGYRSALDGTLQPYSVRLPENFDTKREYPAIVFLHGSGADDRGLLTRTRSNGRFIEIAPGGRDLYRAYVSPASQFDIAEALDKASEAYSINREKVVIGGFSMGGYGALRAYLEHPDRYAGVAVFAGHPDLANEWLGSGFPNFLDPQHITAFKGVPVFIYHGKKDAALPFALAERLAMALQAAGAIVTFSPSENNGHTYQDEATQARFDVWLQQFE